MVIQRYNGLLSLVPLFVLVGGGVEELETVEGDDEVEVTPIVISSDAIILSIATAYDVLCSAS